LKFNRIRSREGFDSIKTIQAGKEDQKRGEGEKEEKKKVVVCE
jgi:hypothetical protein